MNDRLPVHPQATRVPPVSWLARRFRATPLSGRLLSGILAAALGLRLWAITFGLPYLEHPDEPFWIFAALKMIKTGDPNPHDFIYPSFYYYINAFIYLVYYAAGRLLGAFHSLTDLVEPVLLIGGSGRLDLWGLVLGGRLFSALAGCGTVALTFITGRRVAGLPGAVLAALFVAVSPSLVMHNRYMVPDSLMTFFTTLTVAAAWLIYERGRWRDYLLAGIALGLAVGMKYNTAPFALIIVLAHVASPTRSMRPGRGVKDWRWMAALVIAGLAFLLTTPYAILDAQTFLDRSLIEFRHYSGGHAGATGSSLAWYVAYFWQTEGPLLILAAAAILWGLYRRSRGLLLLAAMTAAYLLFISAFAVHAERTALPLVPLFALLAGAFVVGLADVVARPSTGEIPSATLSRPPTQDAATGEIPSATLSRPPAQNAATGEIPLATLSRPPAQDAAIQNVTDRPVRVQRAAVVALVVVALAVSLAGSVREALRLTTPDGLDTARVWIEQNLPPGARIGVESYAPWIDPQKFSVQGFYKLNDHPPEWYAAEGYEYLVFSQRMFRRFYRDPAGTPEDLGQYEALFAAFEPVGVFTEGGYEVRVHRVTAAP